MRASSVVNCQLTYRRSVLVVCCHAASSVLRTVRSLMWRSRHWRVRMDNSISAVLSQPRPVPSWDRPFGSEIQLVEFRCAREIAQRS